MYLDEYDQENYFSNYEYQKSTGLVGAGLGAGIGATTAGAGTFLATKKLFSKTGRLGKLGLGLGILSASAGGATIGGTIGDVVDQSDLTVPTLTGTAVGAGTFLATKNLFNKTGKLGKLGIGLGILTATASSFTLANKIFNKPNINEEMQKFQEQIKSMKHNYEQNMQLNNLNSSKQVNIQLQKLMQENLKVSQGSEATNKYYRQINQ